MQLYVDVCLDVCAYRVHICDNDRATPAPDTPILRKAYVKVARPSDALALDLHSVPSGGLWLLGGCGFVMFGSRFLRFGIQGFGVWVALGGSRAKG